MERATLNTDQEIESVLFSLGHLLKQRLADGHSITVYMGYDTVEKVRPNNPANVPLDGFLHGVESITEKVIKTVRFEVDEDVIL